MEFLITALTIYVVVTLGLLPFKGKKAFFWPFDLLGGTLLMISSMD